MGSPRCRGAAIEIGFRKPNRKAVFLVDQLRMPMRGVGFRQAQIQPSMQIVGIKIRADKHQLLLAIAIFGVPAGLKLAAPLGIAGPKGLANRRPPPTPSGCPHQSAALTEFTDPSSMMAPAMRTAVTSWSMAR